MKKLTEQTQHAFVGCCDMTFIGTDNLTPKVPVMPVSGDVMVEVKQLSKEFSQPRQWNEFFGPKKENSVAVSSLDLTIKRGELFGLVGPNGAGKTTLIKMLTTLIAPTSGSICIDGHHIRQESAVKRTIGLATSDERSFYWRLTGRQNLFFFAALHGIFGGTAKKNIDRVLKKVQLHDVADQRFSGYSTGMKQRLAIARALVTEPKIVFLDEPTKGLDPISTQQIHKLVREDLVTGLGLTVLLTSHQLVEVEELCDRIAIMNHGQIKACGTMTELQNLIGSVEKYRITVQEISSSDALEIAGHDPQIKIHTQSNQHLCFEFDYYNSDNRLEHVIRGIFAKSGKIKGITRNQIPLGTIFNYMTGNGFENQDGVIVPFIGPEKKSHQEAGNDNPEQVELTDSADPVTVESKKDIKSLLGRINSFKQTVFALVKRDMLSETSYRFSLFMQMVETFLTICALFFLSRMLGQDAINTYLKPYGGDYFAFAIIGVGFFKYFNVGYSSFARKLNREQMSGTLEAMLASPAPLSLIVLGGGVWDFIMTTLRVGIFLVAGAFIGESNFGGGNYWLAIIILFLMVASAASFGIISACFIMVVKRGDPISWLFKSSSFLLGGVVFPVAVLPDWMQNLATVIPTTHALKAMRLALLQNHSFTQVLPEIAALCVFCFILLPLSLVALRYSVRLAKRDGSLTHY